MIEYSRYHVDAAKKGADDKVRLGRMQLGHRGRASSAAGARGGGAVQLLR